MQEYITPFIDLTLEMAPYLLLGFLFAGLLHAFVPARFYGKYLSGNNLRSTLTAAAIGVPLPLCSCGVIPTAMSLRRNGASKGATVSFLIATPQTGVDSILATGSLMGWPMAIIRPITALVTAVFGGAAVNRFDRDSEERKFVDNAADNRPRGFWARVKDALVYGYVDMMQDIGKWLIIGLLIAGLITVLVPDNFFDALAGYPLLNMLVVLAIAVPMYVCATGSIPIAVALMLKGLSPGAALVFLMAGPATNMAAMMVVGNVLHRRAMLIYIATIVLGAIASGLVIDYLLPREWFVATAGDVCCHGMAAAPWWKITSAIVLILLLINAFARKHKHQDTIEMEQKQIFKVTGMNCNHCKASVERCIAAIPGVTEVSVDLASGRVEVAGDADAAKICHDVDDLGFRCTIGE